MSIKCYFSSYWYFESFCLATTWTNRQKRAKIKIMCFQMFNMKLFLIHLVCVDLFIFHKQVMSVRLDICTNFFINSFLILHICRGTPFSIQIYPQYCFHHNNASASPMNLTLDYSLKTFRCALFHLVLLGIHYLPSMKKKGHCRGIILGDND